MASESNPAEIDQDWLTPVAAVEYDPATGEERGFVSLSVAGLRRLIEQTGKTYLRLRSASAAPPVVGPPDTRTHYVDLSGSRPRRRARSSCPAVLDGFTLTRLPLPCRIEISDPSGTPRLYEEAESDTLALSFDHPGTYRVRVLSVPHTPGEFEVTAP